MAREWFPFSEIRGDANVIVFPGLDAANVAYKLVRELGGARTIGPIIMGLEKPVNLLNRSATVDNIVDIATITTLRVNQ